MVAALAVACSSSSRSVGPDVPPVTCTSPAPLRDVSSPTAVVGDGTPGSCTAASLQAAADGGGTIVFDCGAAPVIIAVFSPIVFSKETVLDGGGLVTLSGGGASRILLLASSYDRATPRLVVQRLTFRDGNSPSGGADTAVGGGAIHMDGTHERTTLSGVRISGNQRAPSAAGSSGSPTTPPAPSA